MIHRRLIKTVMINADQNGDDYFEVDLENIIKRLSLGAYIETTTLLKLCCMVEVLRKQVKFYKDECDRNQIYIKDFIRKVVELHVEEKPINEKGMATK